MRMRYFLLSRCSIAMKACLIISFGMPAAFAVKNLPPVTITTLREPFLPSPNPTTPLEYEDLAVAHERSLHDVLQGFPGVAMTKVGGYGQSGAVFMRGAGGQGLVSLDDIPLLLTLPGFQNLDTLPTEAIGRAEIERGGGPVSYPFQALGGAIRLYTQEREDSGVGLSLEGGSFGILRETLQGGLSGSAGRMTATLSRGDAFDGVHLARADENPERDPFYFSQGILRFSSDLSARLSWQGSMLYRQSRTQTDNFGPDRHGRAAFLDGADSDGQEETWLAQSTLKAIVSSKWDSGLQLGFTQSATDAKVGALNNAVSSRLYLINWRNRHLIVDDGRKNRSWQWLWGGQGRHEQGESPTLSHAEERSMAAGFIETRAQYGALSGEAGVRVESFERYGEQPLFKTALAWRATADLTLRASGGTGYRLPSYTELLFLYFGNPQLKPERSASAGVGLDWLPSKALRISIDGYYNRYDDLITPAYHPQMGPITTNVADAAVTGLELSGVYRWRERLETGLSYSYSDNRDLNSDRLLPLRPIHSARLWGQQTLTRLPITLWAEAVLRGSAWNDFANTLPVGESVQVNAVVRYAVTKRLEAYLRGENLTDNRTPQFYSADIPGVAVYGGLQWSW